MKKILNHTLILLAGAALMLSCAKEVQLVDGIDNGSKISVSDKDANKELVTITATLPENLATLSPAIATKVSFEPNISGGKTTSMSPVWEAGDAIRIYNHADHSDYSDFELTTGAGTATAKFSGTLPGGSSYDAEVMDASGDDPESMIVQPSDGVAPEIKYFATATDFTDISAISFTTTTGILALSAKMPADVAGGISSVSIKSSEAIFPGGDGKSLTIGIDEPGDTGSDNILNLFAPITAGTNVPAGTSLLVQFNAPGTGHTVFTRYVELGATTFTAGKVSTINVNAVNSGSYANASSTGIGGSTNPYLIGDKYQMDAIHDELVADQTKYFKLVDDIDMTGISWDPLNNVADGSSNFSKYIHFEGNNKTISNLTNDTSKPYPSLFGVLNGTVQNLTISDATIVPGNNKSGVLAGYIGSSGSSVVPSVNNITIINSTAGTPSAKGTSNGCGVLCAWMAKEGATISNISISGCTVACTSYCGGMICEIDAPATISGTNTVSNTEVYGSLTGGVVGFANTQVTMSGCTFSGGTLNSTARYCGGMLGSVADYATVISDCHVISGTISNSVTADARTGGFVGQLQKKAQIKGCSVGSPSGNVIIKMATPAASGSKLNSGGFVGVCYGTITKNGDVHSKAYVTITSTNPSAADNAAYEINLGGFSGFQSGTIEYSDADVSVSSVGKHIGGFCGYLTGGTIRNCVSSGTVAGNTAVGGFLGYVTSAGGTISDCSSSATVSKIGSWGEKFGSFAGLVDKVSMTKCFATSNNTANASYSGGFIGAVEPSANNTATISKCWSTGNVSSSSSQSGGFIGHIAGNSTSGTAVIEDCYETGNTTGTNQRLGGLIGQIGSGLVTVSRCYATANFSAASFGRGGLIGFMNTAATVEDCAAWNSSVAANSIGNANWSTGAVIGVAWPKGTITNNFRNPAMSVKAYWGNVSGYTKELTADYDHPDVSSSSPLIVVDKSTGNLRATTATSAASGQDNYPLFAYHGKHTTITRLSTLASTAKASGGLGWSSDVWDFTGDLPTLK